MMPVKEQLLTRTLLLQMQACLDLGTTDTDALAVFLCRSAETIHTDFKRINGLLGTHSRFEAVVVALKRGWLTLPPPRAG